MAKKKARRGYNREQYYYPYHLREFGLPQEVHGTLWPPWTNRFEILDPDLSEEELKSLCVAEKRCPRILALPLELRLRIYSMLIDCPETGVDDPDYYESNCTYEDRGMSEPPPAYDFVALIRTCRQIHLELAPEVYKRVALNRYQGAFGAIEWLGRIGSNTRHVRHVDLTYQTPKGRTENEYDMSHDERLGDQQARLYTHLFQSLEQKCPNLRSIHVSMFQYQFNRRATFLRSDNIPRYISHPPPEARLWEAQGRAHIRKLNLREASLVLRGLARFHWIEEIRIFEDGQTLGLDILVPPLLAFFLRGSLGFHLEYSRRGLDKHCPESVYANNFHFTARFNGNEVKLTNPFWEPPAEGMLRWPHAPADESIRRMITHAPGTAREMNKNSASEIIHLRNSFLAQHKERARITFYRGHRDGACVCRKKTFIRSLGAGQ